MSLVEVEQGREGVLIMGPKAGVRFDYFEGKGWEKGWSHGLRALMLIKLELWCCFHYAAFATKGKHPWQFAAFPRLETREKKRMGHLLPP